MQYLRLVNVKIKGYFLTMPNSLEGRFFVQVLRIYTAECLENSRAFNETMTSALTETVKMHEIARKKKGEYIAREL